MPHRRNGGEPMALRQPQSLLVNPWPARDPPHPDRLRCRRSTHKPQCASLPRLAGSGADGPLADRPWVYQQALTSETFLAAVDAVRRDHRPPINAAWLIGVARHNLVDHWRRQAREERGLAAVATPPSEGEAQ